MSQLEHPLLRAPVEATVQLARNSQKFIAKDMASIATAAKALAASAAKQAEGPATGGGVDKAALAMAKSLAAMIKEVQALKKKLEESERSAARQSKMCSARLHYLHGVESLAQQSKLGPVDFDHVDAEEPEQTEPLSPPPPPPPRKAVRAQRNVHEDMEIDGASASPAPSLSLSAASVSPAPASRAASKAGAAATDEAAAATSFVVTPQLRLDRIFAEHLLRNNRPLTAARVLASHPALPLLVDADIFATARRVESSLLSASDCSRALAWCGENRSRLSKLSSPFEFDLRLQEFLTLVKQGHAIKAIDYARKHLAPAAITTAPAAATTAKNGASGGGEDIAGSGSQDRNNLSQGDEKEGEGAAVMVADPARVRVLQEAMNLLVFYNFEDGEQQEEQKRNGTQGTAAGSTGAGAVSAVPSPWHKYRVYWSPSRFAHLVREFRATHLALYGLPSRSTLELVLNLGLGSIKTSACHCEQRYDDDSDRRQAVGTSGAPSDEDIDMAAASSSSSSSAATTDSQGSLDPPSRCPACTFPLSRLSRSLPVAARSQSRLVCRLSGAVMDDRNPPLVLPNGFVYSRQALTQMAQANAGRVTCPRTKQTFTLTQARIAYVL